jgi:hypothetical protein
MKACSKALMTTLTVMLPRTPLPPENFCGLRNAFKSSRNIQHLVKLQLVAGAQFALGWVHKWKPKIDFNILHFFSPRSAPIDEGESQQCPR